jgi:hypothetical protein
MKYFIYLDFMNKLSMLCRVAFPCDSAYAHKVGVPSHGVALHQCSQVHEVFTGWCRSSALCAGILQSEGI